MKITLAIIIVVLTALLISPFLIIGLSGENKQTTEVVVVPPEYIPQHQQQIEKLVIVDKSYSPGKKDWQAPTDWHVLEDPKPVPILIVKEPEPESDEWNQYLAALHVWGKEELNEWVCKVCGKKLNENFHFLDRNGKNIRFQCKCSCGHEPIVTLDDNR